MNQAFAVLQQINTARNNWESKTVGELNCNTLYPITDAVEVTTRKESKVIRLTLQHAPSKYYKVYVDEMYNPFFNKVVIQAIRSKKFQLRLRKTESNYFIEEGPADLSENLTVKPKDIDEEDKENIPPRDTPETNEADFSL